MREERRRLMGGLSLFARLDALNRRIPTPPQCALLEGDLAEGFINRLRQVQARVDDGAHGGPAGACINAYHS
jgi:hypothetical protein